MINVKRLFHDCLIQIGGRSNKDVHWYRTQRPKRVSRAAFFRAASWAICVTGIGRKSAEAFYERAQTHGPIRNYRALASWRRAHLRRFMEAVHGRPVPARAKGKWLAIHGLAERVAQFPTEREFRDAFFGGKVRSRRLDDRDVERLAGMRCPFVGDGNAHFIVRNMGGEAVKCDRWIQALLRRYKITLTQLTVELRAQAIPAGLFDVVVWAYCERCVRSRRRFGDHFGPSGLLKTRASS